MEQSMLDQSIEKSQDSETLLFKSRLGSYAIIDVASLVDYHCTEAGIFGTFESNILLDDGRIETYNNVEILNIGGKTGGYDAFANCFDTYLVFAPRSALKSTVTGFIDNNGFRPYASSSMKAIPICSSVKWDVSFGVDACSSFYVKTPGTAFSMSIDDVLTFFQDDLFEFNKNKDGSWQLLLINGMYEIVYNADGSYTVDCAVEDKETYWKNYAIDGTIIEKFYAYAAMEEEDAKDPLTFDKYFYRIKRDPDGTVTTIRRNEDDIDFATTVENPDGSSVYTLTDPADVEKPLVVETRNADGSYNRTVTNGDGDTVCILDIAADGLTTVTTGNEGSVITIAPDGAITIETPSAISITTDDAVSVEAGGGFTFTGDTVIDGTLEVTGAATMDDALNVSGDATIDGALSAAGGNLEAS